MNKKEKLFLEKNSTITTFLIILLFLSMPMFTDQAFAQVSGYCGFPVDPNEPPEDEEKEKCKKCSKLCKKSPVSVANGNYATSAMDLYIPTRGFPLVINREYGTERAIDGFFGYGWTSNLTGRLTYSTYLYAAPSSYMKMAAIVMPNGGVYKFTENTDGSFTPPEGVFDTLVKNVDGSFDLTLELSRNRFHYNAQGYLISITDEYNNSLLLTYDVGTGRPSQVSDSMGSGRFFSISYNPTGQIELIEDHSGRQIQYQYISGKLTRVIDPENRNTDYDYKQGRFAPLLKQIKDHWGRVITDITYDSADRVSTYTEAGEVWTYVYRYENDPYKTSKTDSSENRWVYTFNDSGQVTQTDPPPGLGSAPSYVSYNSNGTVEFKIDERGVRTSYSYNANGTLATITQDEGGPDTIRHEYSYDPNFPEKVISIIAKDPSMGNPDLDWQGQKFDYYQTGSAAPGALFHVYRVRDNGTTLDTLSTYTYNSAGQILTITSAVGSVTTNGYDPTTGDLTSITYPKNSTSGSNPVYNYGRDSLGRVSSITNPLGKTTSYTYDDIDRILTITQPKPTPSSPLSFVTSNTYDIYDAPSSLIFTDKTDPNGRLIRHGHNQYGHLVQKIDALNNLTSFSYDDALLSSITDANGNVTTYDYNGLHQLESIEFPEGPSETFLYWEDGLLKSKTDRKNQTIQFNYDGLKRLTQKVYPNSTSITYTFVGQKLTSVIDEYSNETQSFSYDTSYRLSSNTQGLRGTVNYTYNAEDRVSTRSLSGGPSATYTYYDDGSLKTISWSEIAGTFIYDHTLNGQYSVISFPNGQHRDYVYDDQDRLTQIANIHPTTGNLASYSFGYDTDHISGLSTMLGQRTSMNATVPSQSFSNHQTKYYYDENYRLIQADYPNVTPFNSEVNEWTYDAIGNRLSNSVNGTPQNYSYYINPGNSNNSQRLESDGINTYTYDENGNMISKSGPEGEFTFTYDYENRLIGIESTSTVSYTYDYVGRRTSKTSSGTTTFIYDGVDLIAERGASIADFVFGQKEDEILAMRRSGTSYYFSVGALGSISLVNNTSGAVQNKYVFDSWGTVRDQSVNISNPFGYTGREFNENNLTYYRARYYNPGTGRFGSEDPLMWKLAQAAGFASTSRILAHSQFIELFSYVDGNPIISRDPFGLKKKPSDWEKLTFIVALGVLLEKIYDRINKAQDAAECAARIGACQKGYSRCVEQVRVELYELHQIYPDEVEFQAAVQEKYNVNPSEIEEYKDSRCFYNNKNCEEAIRACGMLITDVPM